MRVAWILEILPSIQKDKTKIHIPHSREELKEKDFINLESKP